LRFEFSNAGTITNTTEHQYRIAALAKRWAEIESVLFFLSEYGLRQLK
jgi:hypothetical protein